MRYVAASSVTDRQTHTHTHTQNDYLFCTAAIYEFAAGPQSKYTIVDPISTKILMERHTCILIMKQGSIKTVIIHCEVFSWMVNTCTSSSTRFRTSYEQSD